MLICYMSIYIVNILIYTLIKLILNEFRLALEFQVEFHNYNS